MVEKRIIFNEFYNEHKLKIVDHLKKKYNWKPVFMSGLSPDISIINQIKKNYPSKNQTILSRINF